MSIFHPQHGPAILNLRSSNISAASAPLRDENSAFTKTKNLAFYQPLLNEDWRLCPWSMPLRSECLCNSSKISQIAVDMAVVIPSVSHLISGKLTPKCLNDGTNFRDVLKTDPPPSLRQVAIAHDKLCTTPLQPSYLYCRFLGCQ